MIRSIVMVLMVTVFSEAASYKIVISSDKEIDKASVALNDIEKFFQENSSAKRLKAEHHFQLKMELLGDYVLTVIKPIKGSTLKNSLKLLLTSKYPKMFTVKEPENIKESKSAILGAANFYVPTSSERTSLVDGITNQWLLFLMLALLGILLMYILGRQIVKIKKLQHKLEQEQMDIDTQIGNIEGSVS